MRNHYIPQFVIREYADKDGMVHVYDKATAKIRQSSPNDVFVIKGFYDDAIEKELAAREAQIAPVFKAALKSCRDRTAFTASKGALLTCMRYLVLLQLTRTPYAKGIGVHGLDDADPMDDLADELAGAGYDLTDADTLREFKEAEKRVRADAAKTRKSRAWSSAICNFLKDPSKAMPDVVKAVMEKGVVFARAGRRSFVLGDRGAVSTAGGGRNLDDPRKEIYFPVSPDVAVSLGAGKDEIVVIDLDMQTTRTVNLSTMRCCSLVIGRSKRLLASLAAPT